MPKSDAIIGRVAVKVLPDTSEFRKRAKIELNKIEKRLPPVKIKIEFDSASVKKAIHDLNEDVDDITADIDVDINNLSRAKAQQSLARLTRPRTVTIIPKVSKAAALKAGTALAALSGARALNSSLRETWEWVSRLDKSTPIIGTVAAAVAGLSAWGMTAASNLFALSESLAQIGPAALALPGIFGGIVIGVGASIAVLKDFNKVLPGVKKQFKELQDQMSINFWSRAKAPFQAMIDTLFPQFSKGMQGTSAELGTFFGRLANSFRTEFDGALDGMFDDLARSIEIAGRRTDAYAGIIKTLGKAGAGRLPQLAAWFGKITGQFDRFLEQADKDGRLSEWIDTGLFMLKELGRAFGEVGSIFAGLSNAAQNAGGSTLTMFADTLSTIADVVNGNRFQKALTGAFRAAHEAIKIITDTAGPAFNDFMVALAENLQVILPLVGEVLGSAFRAIFDALNQPAVWDGVVAFFTGLRDGVVGLAPYLPDIAEGIGALLTVMGDVARAIGPILGEAFAALADVLVKLAPAIAPLIEALGQGLVEALQIIAPYIADLADSFVKWLNEGGIETIASIMGELLDVLQLITPVMVKGIQDAATAISDMAPAVMAIGGALEPLSQFLGFLQRIPEPMDHIGESVHVFGDMLGWIRKIPEPIDLVMQAFGRIDEGFAGIGDAFDKFIDDTFLAMTRAGAAVVGGFVKGLLDATFSTNGIKATLNWLTAQIPDWKGPASKDATLLFGAGTLVMDGFKSGLESRYGAVRRSLQGFTADIARVDTGALSVAANARVAIDGAIGSGADGTQRIFNYHAAPGSSLGAEEDLFEAVERGRFVDW